MSEANANPGSAFTCLLRLNREQGSGPGDSGVGTGQGERPRFMGTIFKQGGWQVMLFILGRPHSQTMFGSLRKEFVGCFWPGKISLYTHHVP